MLRAQPALLTFSPMPRYLEMSGLLTSYHSRMVLVSVDNARPRLMRTSSIAKSSVNLATSSPEAVNSKCPLEYSSSGS